MKHQIIISNGFRKILNQIRKESWIANELLKGKIDSSILVNDPVNYIKISSNDETKISYLPANKINQTLKKLTIKHRGDSKNLLTMAEVPADLMFNESGRVRIKYGSFVNKLFKDVNPKDVEKFTSLLKSIMNQPPFHFKILEGDDIRKYYHYSVHSTQKGSLGVSCMRHDRCQSYFDMYKNNPTEIKMLTMFDRSEKVMARALIWTLGEKNGLDSEFKFMDRVYSTNDDQVHHFNKWANENGYSYKEKQSWNTPYRFQNSEGIFEKKMKIKLSDSPSKYSKLKGGKGLPYLDTFKWIDLNDGTLFNYKPIEENRNSEIPSIFTPVSTEGDVYGFNYLKEDNYHNEYWYEGEIKYVEYLDKYVYEKYLRWSRINNQYILSDHSKKLREFGDDYLFNEEYEKFNNREEINRIIEENKERERLRLEKIKKDVMKTLDYFSQYVEVSEPFLNGTSKFIDKPKYIKESEIKKSKIVDKLNKSVKGLKGTKVASLSEVTEKWSLPNIDGLDDQATRDVINEYINTKLRGSL